MFLRLEEPAQRWHHEAGGVGGGCRVGAEARALARLFFPGGCIRFYHRKHSVKLPPPS